MKKLILQIVAMTIITVIAVTFVYRSSIKVTEGNYQIIGVNDKGIVIQLGNTAQTLRTTDDIVQIVKLDHYYDIRFEKAPLQQPELEYIRLEPSNNHES
ncbi:hypothetical protein [Paenibacillus campi]|uniref:hypothetical protein n=1 Tax=Paenibacillus campi TaxID=3106031 RepID=UPI002AFF14AE|nr:hypothetical protein [Paenibacillus sp. SGZ-1014]